MKLLRKITDFISIETAADDDVVIGVDVSEDKTKKFPLTKINDYIVSKNPFLQSAENMVLLGWNFIQDSQYTQGSPLHINNGIRTAIPNNGLGILTNDVYAPEGYADWYDPITNKFYANQSGDYFIYRFNFTTVPTISNRSATIDFDIGTANLPFVQNYALNKGAGIPTKLSINITIASGNTFATTGGMINITPECDVDIYGINVSILKAFSG